MIQYMRSPSEHAESGRQLVATGGLLLLRQRLGLSRSAMSVLLHMAQLTYTRCERRPESADRMWQSTAERLGRFAYLTDRTLSELAEEGVTLKDLTPMHVVATTYGLPQEVLLTWYRRGVIHAEDLGILGLWIHRDDLHYLREVA